mgnify:CR=1 FL=1
MSFNDIRINKIVSPTLLFFEEYFNKDIKEELIKELTEAKDLGNSQLILLKKQETRIIENIKELEIKIKQFTP